MDFLFFVILLALTPVKKGARGRQSGIGSEAKASVS